MGKSICEKCLFLIVPIGMEAYYIDYNCLATVGASVFVRGFGCAFLNLGG